jgi:ABC-type polysaccharide/polyol phosphate export permease
MAAEAVLRAKLAVIAHIARQRATLAIYLAKKEFSRRYSSTAGGAVWMFAGPILTIFTIWAALEFGVSASGRFGSEFGVNFAVGLAAWLFFADVVQLATVSITSNPHLVKKVVFPVWVLPLATTLSAFVVHLAVLTAVTVALWFAGLPVRLHLLSLAFWMAALVVFGTAVGLLLSSLNVRFRDTSVVAPNLVSLLFWLTPIVWPLQQLSGTWQAVAKANPMALIIEGYRGALGMGVGVAAVSPILYFLLTLAALLALAMATYKRYRPLFADAL